MAGYPRRGMKIILRNGLPQVSAVLIHQERQLLLEHVLLDTGSAGTLVSTDKLLDIGVGYEAHDIVHRVRGVGGSEFVFGKRVDRLAVDQLGGRGIRDRSRRDGVWVRG